MNKLVHLIMSNIKIEKGKEIEIENNAKSKKDIG
jgi:hypothetical protein